MPEHDLRCGSRLLVHVVDHYSMTSPDKVHSYVQPLGKLQDPFTPITFEALAAAVNKAARWLKQSAGVSHETIAFLGCSDLRSIIFFLAGIKVNVTLLILNCYTPEQETVRLVHEHSCRKLLFAGEAETQVPFGVKAIRIPEIITLLGDETVEFINVGGSYEASQKDVVAIVLTSGSTGKAKGVPVTNGRLSALDLLHTTEVHHGRPVLPITATDKGELKYVALDLAYMGGMDAGVICPIFEGAPIVLGPPSIIPHELSAFEFCEIIRQTGADSFLSYPNVIERILEDDGASEVLLSLRDVGYIGGPLNDGVARRISAQTILTPYIGSTEAGSFICNRLPQNLTGLGFIGLNSAKMGLCWEDAGENLFEPIFKRNSSLAKYQGIFHSFPDRKEWRMGDLYSRHATEPDVWKYEGRRDDTIILSHGENIAPAGFESQLHVVPGIKHALLIGNQRPTLALLIQPDVKLGATHMSPSTEEVVARIWPAVQTINEAVGPLAKIQMQRILLGDVRRPFVMTKKGAVSRKRTLALYAQEIERLYASV